MDKIILYSYLKCSTFRKAVKRLDKRDFEYYLIDIVKEPPLLKYLNLALEQYSEDIKTMFNNRGKAFKSLDVDIYGLTSKEIVQLFLSNRKLIKRPFLIYEEKNNTRI